MEDYHRVKSLLESISNVDMKCLLHGDTGVHNFVYGYISRYLLTFVEAGVALLLHIQELYQIHELTQLRYYLRGMNDTYILETAHDGKYNGKLLGGTISPRQFAEELEAAADQAAGRK
ncbi:MULTISPECIES: hypothetical protein [Paenibacillus]|uniref:hypothetical protein n=1 Tax=Paenibacillus TaxID=44249 RepID=UPI0022B8596F|nr:hypothetical protein [Paenibacillus caseinilyticus]MCZ8520840.1 hypothetical protein [Paenibacillus caseinilyticus]